MAAAYEGLIADWAKTQGTVGIRLLPYFETSEDPADPGMNRVLAAAARRLACSLANPLHEARSGAEFS
jgi:hypothetical protein